MKEANNIINNDMEGRWFEAYLPLASLHLTVGQANNRRNMPLKMVIEPQKDVSAITEGSCSLELQWRLFPG